MLVQTRQGAAKEDGPAAAGAGGGGSLNLVSPLSVRPAGPAPEAPGNGLVALVRDHVIGIIQGKGLKPGQALPSENALSADLQVSRAVVREGLRALVALGMVDVGNGRRPRVGVPDSQVLGLIVDHGFHTAQVSVQQIYDVRRTIEVRTATLAALRQSVEDAAAIVGLAGAMRSDFKNPARVMEHDIAFHRAIADASRNPMFVLIVGSFAEVTRKTWGIGWNSRASDLERMESVACHEEIARAIAAGEPKAAEAAMGIHFDHSVKALLNAGIS